MPNLEELAAWGANAQCQKCGFSGGGVLVEILDWVKEHTENRADHVVDLEVRWYPPGERWVKLDV